MASVSVVLPVPPADGAGAFVDCSGLSPERTITIDGGVFSGNLFLEGTQDGGASVFPIAVGPFTGVNGSPAPQQFLGSVEKMRVRRASSTAGPAGAPTVTLSASAATSAVFVDLPVPSNDGIGAGVDVSGGGDINTIGVQGPFSGQIIIEVSTDGGATFVGSILFGVPSQTTQGSPAATNLPQGAISQVRVRRLGSIPGQPVPLVSVGSSSVATGGGGGGGSVNVAIAKFSGTLPQSEGSSQTFAADTGTEILPTFDAQADPLLYPTSARTVARLWACAPLGGASEAITFTLFKNGVATSMTCTIPANAGVGATAADEAHQISFNDGDEYDLLVASNGSINENFAFTAQIEQVVSAAPGGSGITGITSNDGSLAVVDPTGPVVDLSLAPATDPFGIMAQRAFAYGNGIGVDFGSLDPFMEDVLLGNTTINDDVLTAGAHSVVYSSNTNKLGSGGWVAISAGADASGNYQAIIPRGIGDQALSFINDVAADAYYMEARLILGAGLVNASAINGVGFLQAVAAPNGNTPYVLFGAIKGASSTNFGWTTWNGSSQTFRGTTVPLELGTIIYIAIGHDPASHTFTAFVNGVAVDTISDVPVNAIGSLTAYTAYDQQDAAGLVQVDKFYTVSTG